MKIIKPSLVLMLLLVFFSCKKNMVEPEAIAVNSTVAQAGIATFPIDWEHIDVMPTPPGMNTVYMPWGSLTSNQITKEMRNDYHQADGWTLVYNTFCTDFHL